MQNRVTPFGDIVALPGRGLMMGNRGVLHDDARHIVRPSQVRRWIACRIAFRGRHRALMQPRAYTELFFLDEVAALSAGHRPCAECRHDDYQRFRSLWGICHGAPVSADIIDAKLHANRFAGGKRRTYRDDLAALPDGAYIALERKAWLVWGQELFEWSDSGYAYRLPRPARGDVEVLTPRPTVAILAAGYRPGVHPTADCE
ncbi:MAG: hypothetical protein ABI231_02345 [Candidatus Tumulicola sp.]